MSRSREIWEPWQRNFWHARIREPSPFVAAEIRDIFSSKRCHVFALSNLLSLNDRDGERALWFSRDLASDLRMSVTPVSDLTAAVRQSDICVTCTTSRQPLLGSDEISPGTFIAAVGADNPEKQELHPSLVAASKIVCDILEQCG